MKKLICALLVICIFVALFATTASAVDIITDVTLLCGGKFEVGAEIDALDLHTFKDTDYEIKGMNIYYDNGGGWKQTVLPTFEFETAYRYELWLYPANQYEIFDGGNLPTVTVMNLDGWKIEDVSVKEDGALYFNLYLGYPKTVPIKMNFKDVTPADWFYKDVEYVYQNMMMNGVDDGVFDPQGTCTRAMVVTVLFRLLGEPGGAVPCPFTDVPDGENYTWYTQAVKWAYNAGVVNGMTPTTFEPNAPVTREQLAAILYRFADGIGRDVSGGVMLAGFTDHAAISEYAYTPLSWAFGHGIITGVDEANGKFLYPQNHATRCQIAAILHRFCEAYPMP